MNSVLVQTTAARFRELYGNDPAVVRSPGRINIIGEHTDYNEGFVLPAAIDRAVYLALAPNGTRTLRMHAAAFNESFSISLDELKPVKEGWPNYLIGVAAGLMQRGYAVEGFDAVLDGDIPIGSGLSSSAAVENAVAVGLNTLLGFNINRLELIRISQEAEHRFAGVQCGIMDQFASMMGAEGQVIRLDCRSLEYTLVPFATGSCRLLLLNTNVKHSLADSEYNTRRRECSEGVALVQAHRPEVGSLRDCTAEDLLTWVAPVNEVIYRRCRYVVEENARLLKACAAMERGDLHELGQCMFGSHDGLSKMYEVSCPELDYLVDAVRAHPAVLGARMMGGGFGGCTLNLVEATAIEHLIADLGAAYARDMGRELTPIHVTLGNGTGMAG